MNGRCAGAIRAAAARGVHGSSSDLAGFGALPFRRQPFKFTWRVTHLPWMAWRPVYMGMMRTDAVLRRCCCATRTPSAAGRWFLLGGLDFACWVGHAGFDLVASDTLRAGTSCLSPSAPVPCSDPGGTPAGRCWQFRTFPTNYVTQAYLSSVRTGFAAGRHSTAHTLTSLPTTDYVPVREKARCVRLLRHCADRPRTRIGWTCSASAHAVPRGSSWSLPGVLYGSVRAWLQELFLPPCPLPGVHTTLFCLLDLLPVYSYLLYTAVGPPCYSIAPERFTRHLDGFVLPGRRGTRCARVMLHSPR